MFFCLVRLLNTSRDTLRFKGASYDRIMLKLTICEPDMVFLGVSSSWGAIPRCWSSDDLWGDGV